MSRELPEEWGDPNTPKPTEPGLAKKVREQADEIKRLRAKSESLRAAAHGYRTGWLAASARIAELTAALDGIIEQSVLDAVDDEIWDELIEEARKALASDGSAAADVLKAAEGVIQAHADIEQRTPQPLRQSVLDLLNAVARWKGEA